MAARKKKTAKKASKAKRGSALVPIETRRNVSADFMQEYGDIIDDDATAAAGDVGWSFIKTQGGVFEFNEEEIGKEMEVVILEAIRENTYYEGGYDPSNPVPPVCFAMNKKVDELAPPEDLQTKQAEKCSVCQMNVFGTAEQGRGKACKNSVRLVVLPWLSNPDELSKVEGARLRVPVTSVKGFASYTNKLTKGLHLPLLAVVTHISTKPLKAGGWEMLFKPKGAIENADTIRILKDRREEGHASLMALAPAANPDEVGAPKQRRRKVQPRKKKATKKKVKRSKAQAR
jgi:hypothetical protein